jgi:hypothetical protein
MYNQFNLCKLCDDEPEVYNGLCHTCLDSDRESEHLFIGGTHTEKFTHRKPKGKDKKNNRDSFDD